MTATPTWITESEVVSVLNLARARKAVRELLVEEDQGHATTMGKTHVVWGDGHTLHAIGAEASGKGLVGTKTWAHTAGGAEPLLVLWDADTGVLHAVIEAFALGQFRTAAVSSLATDLLAADDAGEFAIIGTGKQAMAQVAAVTSVRRIHTVRVHSPTTERRAAFVEALIRADIADTVVDCASVAQAVDGAAIVTTATRARQPFLSSDLLTGSAHVNALGGITHERREMAAELIQTTDLVVSDSPAAASRVSSELPEGTEVVPLSAIVSGAVDPTDGMSVFKSMGIGLADLAVGAAVVGLSRDHGLGTPIPPRMRARPDFFSGAR